MLVGRLFGKSVWYSRVMEHVPALLTTLGLLGTFWGIAQGLYDFDVTQIEKSVPPLLEGMKLAFWTSILGMTLAFFLKFAEFVFPQPTGTSPGAKSADDIYEAIRAQKQAVDDLKTAQIEAVGKQIAAVDRLATAIGGSGDNSLVSQITMMRSDARDNNQKLMESNKTQSEALIKEFHDHGTTLVTEFRKFAEQMAENNSKAFIKALEDVIRDFNTKITEQFGDNFKQLNEAVGKLLIWQENYKQHVETLTERFKAALDGIEKSDAAIANISANTDSIPATMENLAGLLTKLDVQVEQASALLDGFAAMRNKADEVFPTIQKGMEGLTESLMFSANAFTANLGASVDGLKRSVTDALEGQLLPLVQKEFEALSSGLKDSVEQCTNTLETSVKSQKDSMEALMLDMMDSVKASTAEVLESVTQQRETLQKAADSVMAMQTEIGTAIDRTLEGIKNSLTDALEKQLLPQVQAEFEALSSGLKDSVERCTGTLETSTQRQKDGMEALTRDLTDSVKASTAEVLESVTQQRETLKNAAAKVLEMPPAIGAAIDRTLQGIQSSLTDALVNQLIPHIEKDLEALSSGLKNSVAYCTNTLETSVKSQKDGMEVLTRDLTDLAQNLTRSVSASSDQMQAAVKNVVKSVTDTVTTSEKILRDNTDDVKRLFENTFQTIEKGTAENLGKFTKTMDESLEMELVSAFMKLADHIATLWTRLHNDTQKLSNTLTDLVNKVNGLQNNLQNLQRQQSGGNRP
jgi:DNA anti-recombination protein RmuC